MKFSRLLVLLTILALIAAPSFGAAAKMSAAHTQLTWTPEFDHGEAVLTVVGPDGFLFTRTFGADEVPSFSMAENLADMPVGSYNWSLTVTSRLSDELRAELQKSRAAGDREGRAKLRAAGFESVADSGHFYFDGAQFVVPGLGVEGTRSDVPTKDQVILDDLIVDGSACIGQDCVNGEAFGFDTLRLKENNLRIKAQDTSNSASFPSVDWQITFNDSSNGGANKFSIDEIDSGRTPFTIEASAPSHSLYVDDGGRIGVGTSTPVVEVHVKNGDSPTVRLEQDGSSGFTAQIWDLAGNETNFFIRDVTHGSTLPFRIEPGTSSNMIFLDSTDRVGIRTSAPDAVMHLVGTGGNTLIIDEDTDTGAAQSDATVEIRSTDAGSRRLLRLIAVGRSQFEMTSTTAAQTWRYDVNTVGDYSIINVNSGATHFQMTPAGATTMSGPLTVDGSVTATSHVTVPDYVFEDGYDLMPLDELAAFIEAEGHLPKVPSAEDFEKQGGINLADFQLKLLEKIEELTLYTLSQQDLIEQQQAALAEMQQKLDALTQD